MYFPLRGNIQNGLSDFLLLNKYLLTVENLIPQKHRYFPAIAMFQLDNIQQAVKSAEAYFVNRLFADI
jgi:hypothetical protein